MEWYCAYQEVSLVSTVSEGISRRFPFVKFKDADFSRVINESFVKKCRNPRELWSIFRLWNHGSKIKAEDILKSCDGLIKKYRELAILYIIKAKALAKLKLNKEAEETLLQSLKCQIISPYDKIHIYNDLAEIYLKLKNKKMALKYAQENIKLIDSLSCKYSCGDKTGKIYRNMKRLTEKSGLEKLK
ncbi:MAG: hypothetical protein BWY23_02803 [Spirochaetes bacterium ADurb.Bin218]|nr:MAG: hypothetical protein BWY23_02803 [Spirochaetes bacterium ADurb.Bin218]